MEGTALKVLVACEYSGIVRRAFHALGHDVISCDLLPSEDNSPYHYQGPVEDILEQGGNFDLVIAHPPCDHLCVSGARWFREKQADGRQQKGIDFFLLFTTLECKWAIENPIGIMSRLYRKPDQIIQPWQFGHGETKATCLWLNGLPCLVPTNIVSGRQPRVHHMSPGPDRWKERSRTYQGIAAAMAAQWGGD
jgi:hypothetical protein